VADVLIAGIVAMVISIAAGPRFIRFLRLREYGQPIREEGPVGHHLKQGTPTMGGLLVVFAAAVPYLILSKYSTPALTVFVLIVGSPTLVSLDDYNKPPPRPPPALGGGGKLFLPALLPAIGGWAAPPRHFSTDLYLPVID